MHTSQFFSAVALAATLTAAGAAMAPAYAEDATTEAGVGSRQRMSIPQIHDKLEAAGYRDIRAIELERDGYEVKAVDRTGQRIKLYLDPVTGEVLELRKKRDKREMDARDPRREQDQWGAKRNDAQENPRFSD